MAQRTIRTVDGQVFSGSIGRFRDCDGEILYKRSLFNTVRINKRSITTDDVSGGPLSLLLGGLLIILAAALLVLLFIVNYKPAGEQSKRDSTITTFALPKVTPEAKQQAMLVVPSQVVTKKVIVDVNSQTYHLLSCSHLEQVKQHYRRYYDEEQAKAFGYQKHKACPN